MRNRLVVGKTIKRLHQSRIDANSGTKEWSLNAIEFTDGSFMRFVVIETDGADYGLAPVYPARGTERIDERPTNKQEN